MPRGLVGSPATAAAGLASWVSQVSSRRLVLRQFLRLLRRLRQEHLEQVLIAIIYD